MLCVPLLLAAGVLQPIGHIRTIFRSKFGTPRQGCLVPDATAVLTLDAEAVGGDAAASLEGLDEYSHVWLVWGFHLHANASPRAKISPPVLRGRKVGVFATRAPYRPNPFGLSLVNLDSVDGGTLHLSGVDLVDGSPIYDIKPYISEWDAPHARGAPRVLGSTTVSSLDPTKRALDVIVTPAARMEMQRVMEERQKSGECRLIEDATQLERVLGQCLAADPRPVYRWRKQQRDGGTAEYDINLDDVCARCRFEVDGVTITVLSIG